MAELLSALLPTLLKKAGESLSTEFSFIGSIEQRREKLHNLLLALNQVISDAEEKAYKKPAVKFWIARVKLAACDADDALDELHYEALRSEALRCGHKINSRVRGLFSPQYNPLLFNYKIGKRLQQILERIDDLVLEGEKFKFSIDGPMLMDERMQTHSYVDEHIVIGREGDRKEIVQMLLGARNEKLSIFSIVGMGGLGKTTLAQLIFNDAEIEKGFQKRMWVCVSEEFSVPDIVKKVIDSAIGNDCKLKNDNMELLQQHLRQELSGKRYLLVLDDVWNKDRGKWDDLRTLLGSCGVGSAIIVTTRDLEISDIMGAVKPVCLERLSEEDSWTLFSRRAFGTGLLESSELAEIGKKIVYKCHGVPLALKSMGGLMSTKPEIRDWLAILESNTWNEENEIRAALMLSYKHLPSYMKQCFVFCAVFPKDYEIDKLDLIHLWISNGFIPSERTPDLEAIGNAIFSQLVWRSFFQDAKTKLSFRREYYWYDDDATILPMRKQNCFLVCGEGMRNYGYRDAITCKIHDLMHDLAVDISGDECFCLSKFPDIKKIPKDVHHLAYSYPRNIDSVVQHCRIIRSIFSLHKYPRNSDQHPNFMNSTFRVLGLHMHRSKAFSFELAFMKHLRHLDLSNSDIEAIPEATSALYNLQVLMLNGCYNLNRLPEGMRYMVNLRHVYLDHCSSLKCMPAGLGQLRSLQTLTRYVVGNDPGRGIKELRNLKLGGKLEISGLEILTNPSDAREADLETKQNIKQLTFDWGASLYTQARRSEDLQMDVFEEVFAALEPHSNLKVLEIVTYVGIRFPRWMTDNVTLQNIVELTLIDCVNCTSIPSACQLPCLEVLQLVRMDNLIYLFSNYSVVEKLKFLSLAEMKLLESWEETDVGEVSSVTFPLLDEMRIMGCPKLTALPNVPVLRSLSVTGNKVLLDLAAGVTTLSYLSLATSSAALHNLGESEENHDTSENILPGHLLPWGSLTKLYLKGFNGLIPYTEENRSDQMAQIEDLSLTSCDCFIQSDALQSPLWFWKLVTSLERLILCDCDSLTFWPEVEFQSLTSLKWLQIFNCKNFTGLSPVPSSFGPSAYEGLCNLEAMDIDGCPNLLAFPTCFTCLESLAITDSSRFESIPEGLDCHDTLRSLTFDGCPRLKSLPDMQCLSNLQRIYLSDCISLSSLPDGMHNLIALKSLCISDCPSIEALPEGLQQRLPSLETFTIKNCPALVRKCKLGGDYWDRVKDIPELEVTEETSAEQHSSRQSTARALVATCTNAWYRILFCGRQPNA